MNRDRSDLPIERNAATRPQPQAAPAGDMGRPESADPHFDALLSQLTARLWSEPSEVLRTVDELERSPLRPALSGIANAKLLRLRAHGLRAVGQCRAAVQAYERATAAFVRCGAESEAGRTAIGHVFALALLGDLRTATRIARIGRHRLPPPDPRSRSRLELNLGHAYFHACRLDDAEDLYGRALDLARQAGDGASIGAALHHRGLVKSKQGASKEAADLHRQAMQLLRSHGMESAAMYAEASLALAEFALGHEHEGLQTLQRVRRRIDSGDDRRAKGLLRRELATGFAALGAWGAARHEATLALQEIRGTGLEEDEARLSCLLGRVQWALGWYSEARTHLEQARRFYASRDNRWRFHLAGLDLARVFLATGRDDEAGAILRASVRFLRRKDPHGDGAFAEAVLAEDHLRHHRLGLAIRMARRARRWATHFPASSCRPALALLLARAHGRREQPELARRWAHRAVREAETVLDRFGPHHLQDVLGESRDRFHGAAFDLVLEHGGRRALVEAVQLLAHARRGPLVDVCLSEKDGMTVRSLRGSISRLRDDLLSTSPHPAHHRPSAVRREIERLAQVLDRRAHRARARVDRVVADPPVREWVRSLSGRELVLFDRSHEGGWRAFLVRSDGSVELHALPDLERALHDHWQPLHLTFQTAAYVDAGRRPVFLERTLADSERCFQELAESIWRPLPLRTSEVVVVPHASLHGLPLGALALDFASNVSRVPHPALLRRPSPVSRKGHALLLHGITEGARREANDLGRRLQQSGFEVEISDRREMLLRSRARWSVLHVAAHGVRPPEAMLPENWLLSGLQLEDGWLGFESLDRRTLRGALIYLSSCESAGAGADGGAGLRGWTAAGLMASAQELLLTAWRIDDTTASDHARAFYEHWCAGDSVAVAADRARRALRRQHPHPFCWAGFVAVG